MVVKAIGPVAYRLDLPKNMRIHPVFHVQLLKAYKSDDRQQPRGAPPLPIVVEDGFDWFQVGRVCMHGEQRWGKTKKKVRKSY